MSTFHYPGRHAEVNSVVEEMRQHPDIDHWQRLVKNFLYYLVMNYVVRFIFSDELSRDSNTNFTLRLNQQSNIPFFSF